MASTQTLRLEDKGDHIIVVSDNPSLKNALTLEYHALLLEAMDMAGQEDRIAAVILVGRSGYFSAGGDLGLLATTLDPEGRGKREQIIKELQDCVSAIRNCPKPVIAAVEGGAAGGGFSIVMACDLVVADSAAKFIPAYAKIGVVPDGGLSFALGQSLPHQLACEICLFGAPVSAQTLHQHGLVNRLVDAGEAEREASEMVARLVRGPVPTHTKIKQLLVSAKYNQLADQLDLERETLVDVLESPSALEGINAFLEKRRPDFATAEKRKGAS
ncbi:MAG: enoyl-CoA hydratase-related protein [Pseudomonadota bacterium]